MKLYIFYLKYFTFTTKHKTYMTDSLRILSNLINKGFFLLTKYFDMRVEGGGYHCMRPFDIKYTRG